MSELRVALSTDIEHEGATFQVRMPDAIMARLLPAVLQMMGQMPDEVGNALATGEASVDAKLQLGMAMLEPGLLVLCAEAFDAGVLEWTGVEQEDGSPLACSDKNKQYIPLMTKLMVTITFVAKQQSLSSLGDSAT